MGQEEVQAILFQGLQNIQFLPKIQQKQELDVKTGVAINKQEVVGSWPQFGYRSSYIHGWIPDTSYWMDFSPEWHHLSHLMQIENCDK